MPRFIHLHCHSEYSLIDSLIPVKSLVKTVKAQGMPACAITDHHNLFGLVKFYQAAYAAGIKPIIGVDMWLWQQDAPPTQLILLCQNEIGYRHLTRLVSLSYMQGQHKGRPYLYREWLEASTEGLIVLIAGRNSDLGMALLRDNREQAEQYWREYQRLFPQRAYLCLTRTGRMDEEVYIHAAVAFAGLYGVPVVATNEVCFLTPDDVDAHEVRVCIHGGYVLADPNRPRLYSEQQYLRTPEEMAELFADIPEALENTWHIAQRCNLTLTLGKNYLPNFPIPHGKSADDYFREQCRVGLEERLLVLSHTQQADFTPQRRIYEDRLELEMNVIIQMGFAGYFLIVADFIQWAKDHQIPVGPGRGSGAGSLVAYALKITDLDPIPYDLLFERFLNPERVSMPDFDVDFCMERRDEVIDYVAERYGRDKVSQIITYGSMAAKAVIRDVGRVLDHPYGFVDKLAKLIPMELGITLEKALDSEEALRSRYEQEEEVRELIDMARKLEGLTRNVGKHAGGVVIAPSVLTDFSPLYCEEDGSNLVTQFDKGDVESVGLVKFDFLGLRTLTIIRWALDSINHFLEQPLDINLLPLDDPATYDLFQKAQTTAVFQLESRGMKELLKKLKPTCFEDIIALLALYRPGPIESGMVDDFINRKNDPNVQFDYLHPELNSNRDLVAVLKPTYGVIAYQEQVMQIAQVLAGYSLGGADLLRRAMGKKKPEEMAKQRSGFVDGAVSRGVRAEVAAYVFDLVEKFAGYGFNKSHSAAYALVSYQTAWLKAHYPAAFMAAVLSSDMDNTDKVVNLIDECRQMNLKVLPPDVNTSHYRFTVSDDLNSSIRYGLGAIKGAGEAAIMGIISERENNGIYTDLFEFCRRIDLRRANRRVLEGLIKAGALDQLGPERGVMMASLETAIKLAEKHSLDRDAGQNNLFGGLSAPIEAVQEDKTPFIVGGKWSEKERLNGEKESLGLYLTGHPINQYLGELEKLAPIRLKNLRPTERFKTTKVAGLVLNVRLLNSRRGRMASVMLDDNTARLEVMVYSDKFEECRDLLVKDNLLIIEGEVREDEFNDGGYGMTATQISSLAMARERYARQITIKIDAPRPNWLDDFQHILTAYRPGGCPVVLHYRREDALVELMLGQEWRVKPEDALLAQLNLLVGFGRIDVRY
ncbi:DNA polymerase III subunit alpha [Thioflexithrix psekupsensis]|uniref:DNA polymerase III subunit alpha n=1 Tax=Thioflexithrix psekupsensis TaxID=1570016 RepID=A0A251X4S6_9GAMM|nr:DNA polymerase III subunit alpha [Thioflexithrix psekupsensis]OUD12396.1 DNA polymerase III subunit alpha [Thioflexithrix psekupsensis]